MNAARRTLMAVLAAGMLLLASALSATAHGPQSLADAACNSGTMTAHESLGANAQGHDRIPHSHDAGATCVHLNPRD